MLKLHVAFMNRFYDLNLFIFFFRTLENYFPGIDELNVEKHNFSVAKGRTDYLAANCLTVDTESYSFFF